MSDWSVVSGPFYFYDLVHWMGFGSKEKIKVTFLRLFDNPLLEHIFEIIFSAMADWVIYRS